MISIRSKPSLGNFVVRGVTCFNKHDGLCCDVQVLQAYRTEPKEKEDGSEGRPELSG